MGFCKPHWGALLRNRPVWCSRGSGWEGGAQQRTENLGLYHVTVRGEETLQEHVDCSTVKRGICHHRTPSKVWRSWNASNVSLPPAMWRSRHASERLPVLLGHTIKTSLPCLLNGQRPHGCTRHFSQVTVGSYSLNTPTDKFWVRTTYCDRQICCGVHTLPDHGSIYRQTHRLHPPWNVMFFGTDNFSLESLKILHKYRFDVGPIVMQETIPVPSGCTSKDLEGMLSKHGAEMLISVLKDLPRCLSCAKEQPKEGATLAPKISAALHCIKWEEQTPAQIIKLERAIGFVMPLQTVWMGTPIKVLGFTEVPDSMIRSDFSKAPGTLRYVHESQLLVVRCKDGWVGVRAVILKKRISAKDFYNAYLQPWYVKKPYLPLEDCRFTTLYLPEKPKTSKLKPASMQNV
ncbi:methionyl-tRNA formyltransferase, mitochondrial isoform X2 [Hyperolius riggenbachi]|uniref:methionyl-tRNA formyltransferase, mitochondrial isoform X2 n=1 Tax=Hyperolius riggenbachi TaxID=752182 RepID=UPI0035A2FBB6